MALETDPDRPLVVSRISPNPGDWEGVYLETGFCFPVGASPTRLKTSHQAGSELPGQFSVREAETGGTKNAGCGIEPRKQQCGQWIIPQGKTPTPSSARKAAIRMRYGKRPDYHRGL